MQPQQVKENVMMIFKLLTRATSSSGVALSFPEAQRSLQDDVIDEAHRSHPARHRHTTTVFGFW